MHPRVKPALRRGWRDLTTVQFGVARAHAVVLGPMDPATAGLLDLIDGTRGPAMLREEGERIGLRHDHVDLLLSRLTEAGLLDDATGGGESANALRKRTDVLDRLRPDLASLSLTDREPTGGIRRLTARRGMRVQVRGAGRVGATIAAVLSGAGLGRVDVLDGGRVEPSDVAPGGLPAEAIGERRDESARRLVRRCAPGPAPRRARPFRTSRSPFTEASPTATGPGTSAGAAPSAALSAAPGATDGVERPADPGLSLVVVAPRDGLAAYAPDPRLAVPYMQSGTPHLYAGVIEGTGVVGPLVLPGASACAGCLDLGRAERELAWPRMLAQWRSGRSRPVQACDIGLATTVAGLAATHALAFLDGGLPASTGTRWELPLPELDWRPEPVAPHRECTCGAARRRNPLGEWERVLDGPDEREDTPMEGEPHETMAG
ncbi:ThiF family adenylyltransferase [Streptomyces sp. B-S-A8]|uniref:ThiF family adenylyltransferase n=1 Tax=Streptomyces solicavernae TaxID=3043614 RepID=A0ABT6RXS7_9ACTN|nr:ThiF family adenylyltransferase [Streptomyces sp. B-S-A8]MDI3389238.1 ThiF family adenylyltransferase [Streptomyces sp. B-S-A8]